MFLSLSFISSEVTEYTHFCQFIDYLVSKSHCYQKVIVILDNAKLTCKNNSGKTVYTLENVDGLLALDIQLHLQNLKFEFIEYSNFPPHFKAIYEYKKTN